MLRTDLFPNITRSPSNAFLLLHLLVHLAEDVENEGLHIKVERLVVQEELGEQAEVLAVQFVVQPVHLVDGQAPLPTYIVHVRCVYFFYYFKYYL